MATRSKGQAGSALIVSLIILVLMTIVGLSAVRVTTLQERMTGNLSDRNLAFQAAEAALRDGERLIDDQNGSPTITNSNGLYRAGNTGRPRWLGPNSSDGNGAREYSGQIERVASPPEYFIEELPPIQAPGVETEVGTPVPELTFYRVTARGVGGREDTVVILSSVYRPR